MKVLMAIDGSADAAIAMNTVHTLLRKEGLHVDVLSVIPELVLAGSGGVARDAQQELRRQGVQANALTDVGSPAEDILRLASDYDLVVVGAHGKFERTQPGLGPVSNQIVEQSRGPVCVGRELSNERTYRVLVALDGSESSFEALRSLNVFFDLSTLDVTLMCVVEMPSSELEDIDTLDSAEAAREIEAEVRAEADAALNRASRLLESWGVSTTTIVEEGDPALELTSHAEEGDYDLIVVGASGISETEHPRLGSVSQALAWNAPCSVLIVR
jgi:nucleotide-binding universal stress UspA family protein